MLFDMGVEQGGRFLELMCQAEAEQAGAGIHMFKGCMGSVQFGIAVVCARGLLGWPDGDASFDAVFAERAAEVREMGSQMGAAELPYQALKVVNDDKLRRLDECMAEECVPA